MANNVMITNYEMNFRDMKALAVYLEGKMLETNLFDFRTLHFSSKLTLYAYSRPVVIACAVQPKQISHHCNEPFSIYNFFLLSFQSQMSTQLSNDL